MSLVPVFTAIKTRLLANVSRFTPFTQSVTEDNALFYVQMWNNQLAGWKDEYLKIANIDEPSRDTTTYSVNYPAILIEFDHVENEQMGNGWQIYNDLIIRVHLVHEQLDAMDGTMEQNLDVYNLADAVYAALQKYKPPGCVEVIRQKHGLDWNHGNLYHYILEFGTNYIDSSRNEPIAGNTIAGGTITPVITESYNPSPYIKP